MHINKSHPARAAWISAGLAAVLVMVCPVGAEPIHDQDGAQRPSGAAGTAISPYGLEPYDAEAGDGENEDPPATVSGAAAPPEPRVRERPWRPAMAGQAGSGHSDRLLFQTAAQAMVAPDSPAIEEDAQWARELASAVRDTVRPLYEGLAEAGLAELVLNLEAELGLRNGQYFSDILFGDYWQNTGFAAQPDSVTWAGPGNRADTFNRPNASVQFTRDERNATALLSQLIDEVKPWAITLVALYLLGQLIKLALDYRRWKKARRRKRMAMRARHRRRLKRSPPAVVARSP